MTVFFVVGDCHFRARRLTEGREFVDWVTRTLGSTTPDAIVLLGDLLHSFRVTQVEPFNLMISLVKVCAAKAPTYVIIGNHDYPGPTEYQTDRHFMTPLTLMSFTHQVTVVDSVLSRTLGGKPYVFMPYLPYGRMKEALVGAPKWRSASIVFGHQPIRTVDPLAEPWSESYPMLVSGHIHDTQRPQPNVLYTGSVSQVAINELPDKYVWVLTDGSDSLKMKKIRVPIRATYQIVTHVSTIKENFDPAIIGRHDVRLVIECTREERKEFEATKLYSGLSSKPEIAISYRLDASVASVTDAPTSMGTFDDILRGLVEASEPRVIKAYSLITGRVKAGFVEVPS